MKHIVSSHSERVLKAFQEHLLSKQGLTLRTCGARVFYIREFLEGPLISRRKASRWRGLTPQILLEHVLERSRHDSPQRLQALAGALRSFARFLQLTNRNPLDLTSALPRIASVGRQCLPDHLSPEQLKGLLDSIDTGTASGLRNKAILLCLARLGLRAAEVAGLALEDLRWRSSVVRLRGGKGRRERELPLPKDVGKALAAYLRERPALSNSRHVFRGLLRGGSLSSAAISQVATRALHRAEIHTPRPGAHLLRRTLASHLVQNGVTLKAVADLLGHLCLDTTRLYANVNFPMLAQVARPWPTEAGL
jgi:site-specific recombinase XerD